MNAPLVLRWAAAVLVSLGLAGLLALLVYSTDLALDLWERLQQAPLGFVLVYTALILLIALASGVLMWRIARPRGRGRAGPRPLAPPNEGELQARIDAAETAGVDAGAARAELATLRERQHGGEIYIALLGEASTGKSSLVKALLPDAQVEIAARGGTTGAITRYHWHGPDSRDIVLCDLPGLNTPGGQLDPLCRAEAQRAHLVLYLTQGDLTRRQWQELVAITDLGKPVILALNKIDQFAPGDLDQLQERLAARVRPLGRISVVPISAGGRHAVVKRHADGRSESALQTVPAHIEALAAAIDTQIHTRLAEMEAGRDRAVLHLAHTELETTLEDYRARRANEVIGQYTRKAVLGAMVAVGPGTDVLVEGYLGVALVRALCGLYEVPVRDLDVTHLLKAANSSVRKSLPVVLAVAGNAFKAFPGLGTLAGGCLHAVGYGLLFEGLGRAVASSLSEHRQLSVFPVLRHFKESMNDDLEARAKRLAELALAEEKRLNQRR